MTELERLREPIQAFIEDGEMTWKLMQAWVTVMLQRREISSSEVKAIYSYFGVQRSLDTRPEDRFAIMATIYDRVLLNRQRKAGTKPKPEIA